MPGRAPEHATAPSDFQWAGVRGDKAWASGHEPLTTDGTPAGPFGSVPREVSIEDAQASAGLAMLDILGRLETALGDLDRVKAWVVVCGYVNACADFPETTLVMNRASDLILDLYGPRVGRHVRWATNESTVPFDLPVMILADVEIRP